MASEFSMEASLAFVKKVRIDALQQIKDTKLEDIEDIIDKSLNYTESSKALSNVLKQLNKVESVLYDMSITKMELRDMLSRMPLGAEFSVLNRETKNALNVVGDCTIIAKQRYEHVTQILSAVRSINSNFRLTKSKE